MINAVTFLEDVIVPHKAFQNAFDRIEFFIAAVEIAAADKIPMREPVGFALLGQSRSGKSILLDTIAAKHPSFRSDDGLTVPLIKVTVPSKPTIKGLGELILREIDKHDDKRYTEGQLTRRLQVLMANCKTKVLMLDEFQHFYDKRSQVVWHHVADWLKVLVDSVGCILIVSGLPKCTAVIEQNLQLAGRFRAPLRMPRFSWKDKTDRTEFIACLKEFQIVINPHLCLPKLHTGEWPFRCYCATGGLIGYLKKFLSELLIHAQVQQKSTLILADFDVAYTNFIYSEDELTGVAVRPFSPGFGRVSRSEAIEAAAKIGAGEEQSSVASSDQRRARKKGLASSKSALKGMKSI
jgi:hypothetical protein